MDTTNTNQGPQPTTIVTTAETAESLLQRFVEQQDQQAFSLIVQRYGPLVLGVCRRILRNPHDVEDIFQTTFFTLARQAKSIRHSEAIAVWLHRVAYHAALRLKSQTAARQSKEVAMDQIPAADSNLQNLWNELAPVLDQELNRLPAKYRLPVLLCDVAGMTQSEAAHQIGCPEGTLATRLTRAHALLAGRLTRTGIVWTSSALAVLLAQNAASAAVPPALVASTMTGVSTSSLASTASLGSSWSNLSSVAKSWAQTLLAGKVALFGFMGTSVLAAGLMLQKPAEQNPPQRSSVAEIAKIYRNNLESIQSLRVDYRGGPRFETSTLDPMITWQSAVLPPVVYSENLTTFAMKDQGAKVYCHYQNKGQSLVAALQLLKKRFPDRFTMAEPFLQQFARVTFDEIQSVLPEVPVEEMTRTLIYDASTGQGFLSNGMAMRREGKPPQTAYQKLSADEIKAVMSSSWGDDFLMMYLGRGPGFAPSTAGQTPRPGLLNDLLDNQTCHVISEHETFDGADCVVLEAPDGEHWWLDPELGYAIRRWTMEKPFPAERKYSDFRRINRNFYLPGIIESTAAGHAKMDRLPEASRQQIQEWRYRVEVSFLAMNQPIDDRLFQVDPATSSIIEIPTGMNSVVKDSGPQASAPAPAEATTFRLRSTQMPLKDGTMGTSMVLEPVPTDMDSHGDVVPIQISHTDIVSGNSWSSPQNMQWFILMNGLALLGIWIIIKWQRKAAGR